MLAPAAATPSDVIVLMAPASLPTRHALAKRLSAPLEALPPNIGESDALAMLDSSRVAAAERLRTMTATWSAQGERLCPWDSWPRLSLAVQATYRKLGSLDRGDLYDRLGESLIPTGRSAAIRSANGQAILYAIGEDPYLPAARQLIDRELHQLADELSRAQITYSPDTLRLALSQVYRLKDPALAECFSAGLGDPGQALISWVAARRQPDEREFRLACVVADLFFVRDRSANWGGFQGLRDGGRPSHAEAAALIDWLASVWPSDGASGVTELSAAWMSGLTAANN